MPEVLDGTDEALAAAKAAADVPRKPEGGGGGFTAAAERWLRAHVVSLVGLPVAAVTLFLLYLHQARTMPLNADGSGNALQAWDMLHGNLLLSHWTLSDVSFYLTELPEYMLVELVHGLNGDVVHVATAFTYTLAVLLACWLARGRARGAEAVVRVLIVLVIMLAPSMGVGTVVVLSSPDHFGTAVPLLVIFLAADRLPRRRFTPLVLFTLMAWAGVSDTTAIFVAGGAMAVVAGMRLWQGRGERGYEASLFAAAVLAVAVSLEFPKVVHRLGGFTVHPPDMSFNVATGMSDAFWLTVKSFLDLFGADFFGLPVTVATADGSQTVQTHTVIVLLHLFGVALALWGMALTARRLIRDGFSRSADEDRDSARDSDRDLIARLITVGVLLNVAALMFSSQVTGGPREIAAVLPLGAVVAARVLGPHMVHRKHIAVLALFTVMFSVMLVQHASDKGMAANGHDAEVWLKAHGYTYGLGDYWSSHDITVESGDVVQVRPVNTKLKGIQQYGWESKSTWYDPAEHYANFLVMDVVNPLATGYATPQQAVKQFGKPALTVRTGGQEIMVWNKNLLATLPPPS